MIDQLAYLTPDLPGIGGVIKQRPEDFLVEEQPLYPASGEGEHRFVLIEKRLRSTSEVVRHLADVFDISAEDIGYAGLKDKRAVTRQWFSLKTPRGGDSQQRLEAVGNAHIKLLDSALHENKLQRGHLAGNRFVILVRGVDPSSVVRAKAVLDRLERVGVPNFVGPQRFGYRWVNHKIGRLLLKGHWQALLDLMLGHPAEADHAPTRAARQAYEQGDYAASLEKLPLHLYPDRQATEALRRGKSPREAVMAINRRQRLFFISALQSAVFNKVLDRRLRCSDGPGIDQIIEGDVAWKHDSRSVFAVDQATADHENGPSGRVGALAVSPSGPMWGVRMKQATGLVGRWEQEALADEGLTEADLQGGPQGIANGSRRPMRVVVRDIDTSGGVDDHGPYVRAAFRLPRGSFATVVLREIMKCEVEADSNRSLQASGVTP